MSIERWMLPDGMEEALPPFSWQLEDLRRKLLDYYRAAKYELIQPPFLEHLESLLSGGAQDLEQQTFKLTDPASGRLLGLRSDMTPQAARIAARRYADVPVVRLCYLGTVLRTRPDRLGGPRSPRQVGCEIFGEAGIAADIEILRVMLKTLTLAGVGDVHLDLGHVGIYRAIVKRLKIDQDSESALFSILQRKSLPDLHDFAAACRMPRRTLQSLTQLMDLHGDPGVLRSARKVLADGGDEVANALATLDRIVAALQTEFPGLPLHVDLAELRGYRYETGMVFAAFVPDHGRDLARGGRYDGIGREFGVARPATGFSADINELLRLARPTQTTRSATAKPRGK
ncbi:MAG TPA: ATP phosphoribosyltransferase regulatory subunit [Stenotrophobium sp.]|jgi:ATP phosphoribosyltransferase regulatory subunit|nr:ATP phosphoribosyltransferase regulatory subunit [Stenotrophobium sp.]